MTLPIDIRRVALFLLALLIFLAVAGPACLLTAASAMGMPMSAPSTPMDCDRDTDRSMSACPHSNSPLPATHQSAKADPTPLDVVFVAPEMLLADVTVGRLAQRAERPTASPPSHLTPLRI